VELIARSQGVQSVREKAEAGWRIVDCPCAVIFDAPGTLPANDLVSLCANLSSSFHLNVPVDPDSFSFVHPSVLLTVGLSPLFKESADGLEEIRANPLARTKTAFFADI
jgi:hypothetical protein